MLPGWAGLALTAILTAALLVAARVLGHSLAQHVRPPPSCSTPRKRADKVRGQLQGTDSGYTLSARDHLARRGSF